MPRGSLRAGLNSFECFDFSGGLDVQTSPQKLAILGDRNKWLTVATNVVYGADGSVAKRWGTQVASALTDGSSGAFIKGGIDWWPYGASVRKNVVHKGGSVFTVLTSDGTYSATIKSGLTTTTRQSSMVIYNDALLLADGVDAPQTWDGTTWAALGGSSPATANWFVGHGNRVFALAVAAPSRLYWSKLNNAADWSGTTDAGFLDVNPNDGGTLVSLVPGIQELALLKSQRPYRLQGIGPTTGYTVADALTPAVGSIGATASHASAFGGMDVFYMSHAGVHRLSATQNYGDLDATFVSHRIQPYFRPGTTYAAYDQITYPGYSGFADSPQMIYDATNDLLFCASRKQSGSVNCDRILVYDQTRDAWSHWYIANATATFFLEFSCFWNSYALNTSDATIQPQVVRFGAYDRIPIPVQVAVGQFVRGTTSDLAFNAGSATPVSTGVGIPATIRHVTHLGVPNVQKTPRHLFLYFGKETSSTTITLNVYTDFKTTASFTTTVDITSSTAETQVIKRVDLPSMPCEYFEIELSNATIARTFTFYGYEVQWRAGRQIRRAE